MAHNSIKSGWFSEGYIGFNGSLPPGPDLDEIDEIFFSLDNQLQTINQPPVAILKASSGSIVSSDPEEIRKYRLDNYDDQRGFFVEFSEDVSIEHIKQAVDIVIAAFKRIKDTHPDAGVAE